MKKIALIIAALVISMPVFSKDEKYLIIPYFSDDEGLATQLDSNIRDEAKLKKVNLSEKLQIPAFKTGAFSDSDFIAKLAAIGHDSDADLVMAGTIETIDYVSKITTYLIATNKKKIVYSSTLYSYPEESDYDPAFDICGRIRLYFEEHKTFQVNKLTAAAGASLSGTNITWDSIPDCSLYRIYRTKTKNGLYLFAGQSTENSFKDTTAEPGVKYYYSVAPYYNGVRAELSDPVTGYRKPPVPKDESLRKIVDSYTKPRPKFSAEESKKVGRHIQIITGTYYNKTKLQLTLFIARSYIDKKELLVYRGVGKYNIDKSKNRITLTSADNSYEFFFDSNTFFSRVIALNDDELIDILVRNSIFFCVPSGETEIQKENGESQFIPRLEVASLCTQYFKDCREWPESTLMFATRNQDLRNRMEDARKQSESSQ